MADKKKAKKPSMFSTNYAADMKSAAKRGDKKAYYTAQRKRADKTGDKKMQERIYSKLDSGSGKKAASKVASVKRSPGNPTGTDPSAKAAGNTLRNIGSRVSSFLSSGPSKADAATRARASAMASRGKKKAAS